MLTLMLNGTNNIPKIQHLAQIQVKYALQKLTVLI
jgi:hypothetical protein